MILFCSSLSYDHVDGRELGDRHESLFKDFVIHSLFCKKFLKYSCMKVDSLHRTVPGRPSDNSGKNILRATLLSDVQVLLVCYTYSRSSPT